MKRFHVLGSAFLLVALAVVTVAEAQPGRGRGGGGGGLTQLLAIEGVADELELTTDQIEEAKEASEKVAGEMREEMEKARGDFDFRNASEDDRAEMMKKMQEVGVKFLEKERKALDGVLLKHQVERLEQLRVQQMGSRALSDASIGEKLKITEEQKKKLQKISDDSQSKMRELFSGGNRENMAEKMTEMRAEIEKEVMSVLTKKQKETLEELTGDTFKFPERQFGDRGGNRGGNQGDNGGGNPTRPAIDEAD